MRIDGLVHPGESVVAVGIDTADVVQVAAALDRFGPAYLARVTTPDERRSLTGDTHHLASLWAAKEAVTKTLAPPASTPWPWTGIDVDLHGGSARLHGHAARLAAERGIGRVVVRALAPAALQPLGSGTTTVVAIALTPRPLRKEHTTA